MATVMLTGLGTIGAWVLEFLARSPKVHRIVCTRRDEDIGRRIMYNAMFGAAQLGFFPEIEFIKLDLADVKKTAQVIERTEPDVIFNSACVCRPHSLLQMISAEKRSKAFSMGLAPFLPFFLFPIHNVMDAVNRLNIKPFVINMSYPDAVNSILGKIRLAPALGAGNLDLYIPAIKRIVSNRLSVPLHGVRVFLVADRYVGYYYQARTGMKPPLLLKIYLFDKDITKKFDLDDLMAQSVNLSTNVPSPMRNFQFASSAVKNVLAILGCKHDLTHVPGPNGLPGGWPVRLDPNGARVVLPRGVTLGEAMNTIEEQRKGDGIETIESDGTVILTDRCAEMMKEVFGFSYNQMRLEEIEEISKRLHKAILAFGNLQYD